VEDYDFAYRYDDKSKRITITFAILGSAFVILGLALVIMQCCCMKNESGSSSSGSAKNHNTMS